MVGESPHSQREPEQPEPPAILFLAVIQASLVPLAFPLGWLFDQPPLETLRWEWDGLGRGVVAALPMIVVFFLLYHFPVGIFAAVRRFTVQVLVPLLRPCSLFELFGLALLAGLGEELIFRGVVQAALTRDLSLVWGVALASVFFGLMHPVTIGYFLLTTVLGVYLGLVWVATGNLLVPIVAHFLYDFVAMVYLVRVTPSARA